MFPCNERGNFSIVSLKSAFDQKLDSIEKNNVRIHQMSAGVDISMAVSTTGHVYAWGKATDGRIGLGLGKNEITIPRRVDMGEDKFKAVDVECGYVHSIIIGLDGSVYQCGGVGTDGKDDGQQDLDAEEGTRPGEIVAIECLVLRLCDVLEIHSLNVTLVCPLILLRISR